MTVKLLYDNFGAIKVINLIMKKNVLYLALCAGLMMACEGPEGEIGPQGEQGPAGEQGPQGDQGAQGEQGNGYNLNGYIQGTATGTLSNEEAYSINFQFENINDIQGFEDAGAYEELALRRFDTERGGYFTMNLAVYDRGTESERFEPLDLWFEIAGEQENNTAVAVTADANFKDQTFKFPIDPENTTYDLVFFTGSYSYYNDDVISYYFNSYQHEGTNYSSVKNEAGDLILFNRAWNGGEFALVIRVDGSIETTGTKYDNLVLKEDENWNHYLTESGTTDLSALVEVPADEIIVNNFAYNAETGDLSFEYVAKVGGFGRRNSSKHPIEITGSVKAEGVYDSITYEMNDGDGI